MFRFGEPIYLYLLLLLIPLLLLDIFARIRRVKRIKRYGEPALLRHLSPEYSVRRSRVKSFLLLAVFVSLVFMLARPQFGTSVQEVKRKGLETVIALDVSNSMLAKDVAPDRLSKSKAVISRLLDNSENDKIAFIAFAGEAFTQLPITTDYISAKIFLESMSPSFIARQGTDIRGAIELAMKSFTDNENVGRSIVLITDGENHEQGAVEAAREAAKKGIHIFVLGVGSPEGAPLYIEGTDKYRRDNQGNIVMTRLNEAMCKELAQAGSGLYIHVDNTTTAENLLKAEMDKLAKKDVTSKVYSDYDEQFGVVAAIALFLLLVDTIILNKKNAWLRRFKFFE